jgi:DNA-binding beta-propeller fold protein YncE
MVERAHRGIVLALAVASASACAHAQPRPPPAEVVWPEAPAAPRVRLAAEYPDPDAPPPKRSWWRVVLDAVAGVSDEDRRREGQLARPFGVAVLANGDVIVADPDAPGVVRYRPDRTVAQVGCRELDWAAPMAVAAAPDGALWVADGAAGVLVRVAPDGACRALGAGILERPTGLALDGDRIVVADPPRHQVVVLSLDGRELGRWGTLGEGDGELHFPSAVARAHDGSFLVVDALNFRVARFGPDGTWRDAFGFAGDGGAAFSRPKGIAVDEAGRLYVTDAQRDAVLVFAADGTFDVALGATGRDRGRLSLPAGVAVKGGRIFVADSHNHRVQVFELLGGPP